MNVHGQALVEFALVAPLLLFLLLAFGEVGFLMAYQHGIQRSADAVADAVALGAEDPGVVIAAERSRTGCDADPAVTFPDGSDAGDRVVIQWTCGFTGFITSGVLDVPISVESVAVLDPSPAPSASPSPTPSAS